MSLRRVPPCVYLLALLAACTNSQGADDGTGTTTTETTDGPESTGTDAPTGTTGDPTTTEPPTGTTDVGSTTGPDEPPPEPESFPVLQDIVFYDGYAATVDEPIPEGVLRHSNALVATRFTDEMLAKVQTTLTLGVIVGALCDNYDRLGSVNLALVPKGAQTYVPAEVDRIEVARFITPFMDMNKHPMTVPYEWQASDLVPIFKDPDLLAEYDFWFELSIFGVPYAANNEVAGCADRNDTQLGTLLLYTDSKKPAPDFGVLVPVAISQDFNNYTEGASDELGTTRKTVTFELPADTADAQLVLITSNHGANAGGEEYIRREHYVYVDGEMVLQYKPGRPSCEPFRPYNTQPNGIYGPYPQSDEDWQSFSNWCPGDVIDTRIIPWGAASAGTHEFVIDVPDATFVDMQGNFPFSLYVQAQ
ncbi:peptide-N-glycosidase F-related protein [Nannocystis punicea]|uniref:Peptide-N-glycosidase F-related protein n=1 Tax=Nannocystis punicea TaxID=2995304 RepID=A0ABY7GV10_9BACT|nr:peptide-N-glycosidase F-related protein [Nannocystis poenicansa]WAS90740.1 peptide-N-glycosidase F-related protein [Nannocystis poenicansa]